MGTPHNGQIELRIAAACAILSVVMTAAVAFTGQPHMPERRTLHQAARMADGASYRAIAAGNGEGIQPPGVYLVLAAAGSGSPRTSTRASPFTSARPAPRRPESMRRGGDGRW